MEVKLPTNPYIYSIILGSVIIIIGAISVPLLGKSLLVYGFFLGFIGGGFLIAGYRGLKKTQDLKDKKMKEEINLLKKQQEPELDHGRLL